MTTKRQQPSPAKNEAHDYRKAPLWRIVQWVDDRTGGDKILRKILNEPIPGGARFAYVFGSALLFIFVLQLVTGLSLALYYVPSPLTAHTSVSYIVKEVAAGSFLRSLHSYGSSAMVVVLLLHFLQTFLYGSYKGKRELLWIAGCVLLLLVLGMAFTGYLLPWDQKAYFATSVGTNVAGQTPIVGEWVRRLLRGGSSMGTLTISRFYVLHVFVIPVLIVSFVAFHVLLFRKAGPAGAIRERNAHIPVKAEMFYPSQVLKDMAFALVVMGTLGLLAHFVPMKLGPIANPADSHFLPRPEWYYLPLFQWLKYWEGPRAVIGMVVIPTVLVVLLFLLPFLDRGIERRPWRRPIPLGGVAIVLLGLLWLGMKSRADDSHDPAVSAQLAQQQKEEDEYFHKPFQPYRASLSGTDYSPERLSERAKLGKGVFDSNGCSSCHGRAGSGGSIGPALTHMTEKYDPSHVVALLRDPTARMRAGGMVPPRLSSDEMAALVSYLGSLGTPTDQVWLTFSTEPPIAEATGAKSDASTAPLEAKSPGLLTVALGKDKTVVTDLGSQIFQSHACIACHGEGGVGTQRAPALTNLGVKFSVGDLTHLLRNPTAKMTAGGMPRLDLDESELSSLVSYLRELRPARGRTQSAGYLSRTTDQGEIPRSKDPINLPISEIVQAPAKIPTSNADLGMMTVSTDQKTLQSRGEIIFASYGCSACHGEGGIGTRLAPALTHVGQAMRTAELTALVEHPTAKMRAGGMPQVNLSRADMDALIAYVWNLGTATKSPSINVVMQHQLHQEQDMGTHSIEAQTKPIAMIPVMTESEQTGGSIFEARGCSRCHGVGGREGTAAAPPLTGNGRRIPLEVLIEMLQHPTNHMRQGGMPTVSATKPQLEALAAYVSYISGGNPILQPVAQETDTRRPSLEASRGVPDGGARRERPSEKNP